MGNWTAKIVFSWIFNFAFDDEHCEKKRLKTRQIALTVKFPEQFEIPPFPSWHELHFLTTRSAKVSKLYIFSTLLFHCHGHQWCKNRWKVQHELAHVVLHTSQSFFGACASWRRRHMQFSFVPSRSRRRTALPPFFLLLHAIPYHAWPIFVQSSFHSCTAESIARPRSISLWPIASRTSSTSSSSSSIPPKTRKSRVYESSPTPESGLPPHSCRYTLDDLELEKLYILRRLLHSRTHHERQNGEAFAMWGRKELFFSVVQGTAKLLEWENSRCEQVLQESWKVMEGKSTKTVIKWANVQSRWKFFTKNFYWVVEISLCQKVAKFWCVEQHTTETFRFFSLKVHILLSYYVVVAEKDENKKNFRHKTGGWNDENFPIFRQAGSTLEENR